MMIFRGNVLPGYKKATQSNRNNGTQGCCYRRMGVLI